MLDKIYVCVNPGLLLAFFLLGIFDLFSKKLQFSAI